MNVNYALSSVRRYKIFPQEGVVFVTNSAHTVVIFGEMPEMGVGQCLRHPVPRFTDRNDINEVLI